MSVCFQNKQKLDSLHETSLAKSKFIQLSSALDRTLAFNSRYLNRICILVPFQGTVLTILIPGINATETQF